MQRFTALFACLTMLSNGLGAQVVPAQQTPSQAAPPGQVPVQPPVQPVTSQPAQIPAAAESLRPTYVLGPGDMVQVRVIEVEEIGDRPFRVETNGEINLPLIGPIRAAGLTVDQLQAEINQRLRKFVVNPQATVIPVQFRSDPAFFIGAFRAPGIYPLQGRRTLMEMLTIVGGLAPDASRRIKLARRKEMGPIPLPNAVQDPEGKGMVVEIALTALTKEINPVEDIPLLPYDVLTAEKAGLVYLSGQVVRPGGYEMGDKESLGLIQVLSLAGGPTPDAKLKEAYILRPISNTAQRAGIKVNLQDVAAGRGQDIKLMANDVLYIPRNNTRIAMSRVLLIAIPLIPTLILIGAR